MNTTAALMMTIYPILPDIKWFFDFFCLDLIKDWDTSPK
jgi:hypothetical protein